MSKEYTVHKRVPTLNEFRKICAGVDWEDYINFDVAEASLNASLFGVVVQYKDEIVGMGRVVGDGQIYFYIQDIAVLPDHQHQGIGKLIMNSITAFLKEAAPDKAFVGLFASKGKEPFYASYHLQHHEEMTGMFGVIFDGKIQN